MQKKKRTASFLIKEGQVSGLKNEINRSRGNLKVVGIASATLIGILLLGWFASYVVMPVELNLAKIQAEMNDFESYYVSQCKQRYGVDDLESYLDRFQWTEGTYVSGKFDCSEMSAYVEWRLENEGYHTLIIFGQSPLNRYERHVWLLVETTSGKYMPVEATQFELVKWDNPYFDLYFEYDRSFETISEALDYNYNDFNWWGN